MHARTQFPAPRSLDAEYCIDLDDIEPVIRDVVKRDPGTGDQRRGAAQTQRSIVIIESWTLIRDCLARCIRGVDDGCQVHDFGSLQDWKLSPAYAVRASAIVLCAHGRKQTETEITRGFDDLADPQKGVPIVLLSDVEELNCVLDAIERGAQGYIPTSVSLDVALGAMRLIQAGGTFVPASTVVGARSGRKPGDQGPTPIGKLFTERQTAIVESLRRGKANKLIAYELNMCESTVKVHVRNIMKKLKARNRTEIVYKTMDLFTGPTES